MSTDRVIAARQHLGMCPFVLGSGELLKRLSGRAGLVRSHRGPFQGARITRGGQPTCAWRYGMLYYAASRACDEPRACELPLPALPPTHAMRREGHSKYNSSLSAVVSYCAATRCLRRTTRPHLIRPFFFDTRQRSGLCYGLLSLHN